MRGINGWSFLFSIIGWVLFIFSSSIEFSVVTVNPHYIVAVLTIITLILSVLGLKEVRNGRKALISIISLFLCTSLLCVEVFVITFGSLLS